MLMAVVVLPSAGCELVTRIVCGGFPADENNSDVRKWRYASLIAERVSSSEIRAVEFAALLPLPLALTKLPKAIVSDSFEASILSKIAGFYAYTGDNQKAIEIYNQALELFKKAPENIKILSKNRTTEAYMLNNLGVVYSKMGDMKLALEKYTQAFDIAINVKEYDAAIAFLRNIASANFEIGEKQKAIIQLERVLQYSRDIKSKTIEMNALDDIGFIYSVLLDTKKAITNYSLALKKMK